MTGKDSVVCNKKHVFEITRKKIKNWVAKQRLPTLDEVTDEALRLAVGGSIYSLCFALCGDVLINHVCIVNSIRLPTPKSQFFSRFGEYKPMAVSFIAGGVLERTRNCAIMLGCRESFSIVMKNIRGKDDDVKSSLVAGFGCGVVISLVTGMRGPSILSVGVICAFVSSGMFLAGFEI